MNVPKEILKAIDKYNIKEYGSGYHTSTLIKEYYTLRGKNGMPICVFEKIQDKWKLSKDFSHSIKIKKISSSITSD